jgi:hypothetical protein
MMVWHNNIGWCGRGWEMMDGVATHQHWMVSQPSVVDGQHTHQSWMVSGWMVLRHLGAMIQGEYSTRSHLALCNSLDRITLCFMPFQRRLAVTTRHTRRLAVRIGVSLEVVHPIQYLGTSCADIGIADLATPSSSTEYPTSQPASCIIVTT